MVQLFILHISYYKRNKKVHALLRAFSTPFTIYQNNYIQYVVMCAILLITQFRLLDVFTKQT